MYSGENTYTVKLLTTDCFYMKLLSGLYAQYI